MGCCSCCCRCSCCKPSRGNQKCWMALLLTFGTLCLVAGFMAGSTSKDTSDNLKCIVGNVRSLLIESASSNLTAGADAADAINKDTLDGIDQAADDLERGMMAPGLIAFLIFLMAVLTAALGNFAKVACCYPTSKCFLFIGYFIGLMATVFFVVLIIAGVVAGLDDIKVEWEKNVGEPCRTSATAIEQQLATASAQIAIVPQTHPDYSQLVADQASAQKQLEYFTAMCTCISESLEKIEPFAGPGMLGVISTFFCLILQIGLCRTMNCCSKFDESKVMPVV